MAEEYRRDQAWELSSFFSGISQSPDDDICEANCRCDNCDPEQENFYQKSITKDDSNHETRQYWDKKQKRLLAIKKINNTLNKLNKNNISRAVYNKLKAAILKRINAETSKEQKPTKPKQQKRTIRYISNNQNISISRRS
jgi:hypothetical protein